MPLSCASSCSISRARTIAYCNWGNPFVTAKMMTTKWPLAAILMEIGVQVRLRQVELNLGWIPRLQNIEADAITNAEFGHFTDSNRVEVSVKEVNERLILLPHLLKIGEEFMLGLREAKAEAKAGRRCRRSQGSERGRDR